LNDKMEYSLHFVSEDMGLHYPNQNENEEPESESEYYEYGEIEIAKELYRTKMW